MYPLRHQRASPGGHLTAGPLHRHAIVDELTRCIPDSIHSLCQNATPPGNLGKPLIYVNRSLLCYHSRINSLTKECITLFTFNGVKPDHHVTVAVILIQTQELITQTKETSCGLPISTCIPFENKRGI